MATSVALTPVTDGIRVRIIYQLVQRRSRPDDGGAGTLLCQVRRFETASARGKLHAVGPWWQAEAGRATGLARHAEVVKAAVCFGVCADASRHRLALTLKK